ncbi:hypothetical protein ABPG75_008372 [Micractinium tetrahymenae]
MELEPLELASRTGLTAGPLATLWKSSPYAAFLAALPDRVKASVLYAEYGPAGGMHPHMRRMQGQNGTEHVRIVTAGAGSTTSMLLRMCRIDRLGEIDDINLVGSRRAGGLGCQAECRLGRCCESNLCWQAVDLPSLACPPPWPQGLCQSLPAGTTVLGCRMLTTEHIISVVTCARAVSSGVLDQAEALSLAVCPRGFVLTWGPVNSWMGASMELTIVACSEGCCLRVEFECKARSMTDELRIQFASVYMGILEHVVYTHHYGKAAPRWAFGNEAGRPPPSMLLVWLCICA